MKREEYKQVTTTHKKANLILLFCFCVAVLGNYLFITNL